MAQADKSDHGAGGQSVCADLTALLLTFAFLSLIYTTIIRWLHWAHNKVTETTVACWAKQLQV
jgi:hypothetical protein